LRKDFESTVSHVLIPTSNACLSIGSAWASGSVHPIALDGEPKDIAPRITLETLSPDFPSLQKGVLVSLVFLVPPSVFSVSVSGSGVFKFRHTGRIPF
jgi:hypothetical protein